MHRFNRLLGLSLCSLSATSALAQTPPDAGALQQQIERERAVQLPKQIAPDKPVEPAAMKPASGVVITVKQFRFAGNTLLNAEQLAPAVAGYLDRPLDFNQLQAAAAAVADTFRAAGWVVRAYLPAQDIQDGIVTIQVVEAVFGGTQIEGQAQRMASSQILRGVDAQQAQGQALNADALDRALLLADDLPGVAVSGALRAGKGEGETDLVLKLADEALLIGNASLDNTGARSTGQERLAANFNLNSPFGIGDQVSANLILSRGSDYVRLGYSVPIGAQGWRVGANASRLAYELVGSDFSALQAEGASTSVGVEASYPLIRSRLKNLYLLLNVDRKNFDNKALGITSSDYDINNISIGLNGNLFDNLGGGGANSASLVLVKGKVDLGTLEIRENPAVDGGFSKFRYGFSRQQVITNQISLLAALTGQETSDDLDSSEKFYLGGAYGVRAYPTNEASGGSGIWANIELRWRLPQGLTLIGFYDHGRVRNDDGSPSYSLKGAGLAAAWQTDSGLNLRGTWARRIGNNPNPAINGDDQDGSLNKNRIWLSASLSF
jgi:hemolysin activation/secretion protein